MESEILHAMKEDMQLSMLLTNVIVLLTVLLTSASIAWLCLEEIRHLARRMKPAPEPLELDQHALMAVCPSRNGSRN